MKQIRLWLLPLLLFASQALASTVWVLPVKGAIGPALSDYLSREIEEAQQNGVDLVILKMDTPGGLDSSMRDIIHAITTSSVPIATWVGPSGSRAASAGTYILLASHVAAMAEATNLGSATPVSLGGAPQQPSSADDKGNDESNDESSGKETLMKCLLKPHWKRKSLMTPEHISKVWLACMAETQSGQRKPSAKLQI